jgi:hypothetical protein
MTQLEHRLLNDKFMLRLPDGLRERIKNVAAANNRSMNSEIVAALEEKYPAPNLTLDQVFSLIGKINLAETNEQRDKLIVEANEILRSYPEYADRRIILGADEDGVPTAGLTMLKGRRP